MPRVRCTRSDHSAARRQQHSERPVRCAIQDHAPPRIGRSERRLLALRPGDGQLHSVRGSLARRGTPLRVCVDRLWCPAVRRLQNPHCAQLPDQSSDTSMSCCRRPSRCVRRVERCRVVRSRLPADSLRLHPRRLCSAQRILISHSERQSLRLAEDLLRRCVGWCGRPACCLMTWTWRRGSDRPRMPASASSTSAMCTCCVTPGCSPR
jgi:hypothetical protein